MLSLTFEVETLSRQVTLPEIDAPSPEMKNTSQHASVRHDADHARDLQRARQPTTFEPRHRKLPLPGSARARALFVVLGGV